MGGVSVLITGEGVKAADHRSFIEVGQVVDNPGNSSYFSTNLSNQLGHDLTQVLSIVDCACKIHI